MISCGHAAKILIDNIHYVHFSQLIFSGCSENKIKLVHQLTVNGSTFNGQHKTIGTAFELSHTNATITNCSFLFNSHGSYRGPIGLLRSLMQKTLQNSAFAQIGGALIINSSNVSVTGSHFEGNSAELGGAIFITGPSNITVIGSKFVNNHAFSDQSTRLNLKLGGAIFFEKGANNPATSDSIYEHKITAIITLVNTAFINNTATTLGGAIVVYLIKMEVFKSTMIRNSAIDAGGALSIYSSNLTIFDGHFVSNIAQAGGAIAASESLINIADSNFSNNKALQSLGGVLLATTLTIATISESLFYSNSAQTTAGVISMRMKCNLIISKSQFNHNQAIKGGVIAVQQVTAIFISESKFYNNTVDMYGGVLSIKSYTSAFIQNSTFHYNFANSVGGVFIIVQSITKVVNCEFIANKAQKIGGIFAVSESELVILDSEFDNNTVTVYGGVLHIQQNSSAVINKSHFNFNKATLGGVTYITNDTHITFNSCFFDNNSAAQGGAIYMRYSGAINVSKTSFTNNHANEMGGAIYLYDYVAAYIEESMFTKNVAIIGGAFIVFHSPFIYVTNTQISQSFAKFKGHGALYLLGSKVYFADGFVFTSNIGSVYAMNTNLYLIRNTTFENNTIISRSTKQLSQGGAITIFRGNIVIEGTSYFYNNSAENGAAIHATNSVIVIGESVITVANNTARHNGGGFYLDQSTISCPKNMYSLQLMGNHAHYGAGGIYAVSSTIELVDNRDANRPLPLLLLHGNSAQVGGGLVMEVNSKLYILKDGFETNETANFCHIYSVMFSNNVADYGGAIAVDDGKNVGGCDSNPHKVSSLVHMETNYTECFLQILNINRLLVRYTNTSLTFSHNFARYAGSTLFGGLLDRCIASSFAEIYTHTFNTTGTYYGVHYFKSISNILLDDISSYPVKVCFCNDGMQPDCNYTLPMKYVKKGERFTVALVAVDQVNHTISNTTILSYPTFTESGLGEGQLIQTTGDSCTELTYSITTTHEYERLVVYAEGPCRDFPTSQKWIHVQFIPCTCPIGFQMKDTDNTDCVCTCDTKLLPYISDCNVQEETITKNSDAWISYVSTLLNSSGYLIYNHCPFDYCFSPNSNNEIKINLNQENGSDAQCAYNRMGTLCGTCRPGFSLSLGSSRCVSCSHWHTKLSTIISVAIISGIGIVAMLLMLNLTVAVGTLNGVIFYANIVASNFSTFLPFSSPNFITVFIAWLNLDIGMNICFFEGLDSYWKLWFDILFSTYLISLVALVIIISERSSKFARLLGRKNPVATLATLILLSYTKLLRTVILSCSFAVLKYPDNSTRLVWLPDGTVGYLRGKHIALFIAGLVIVIIGVAYTTLLFLWQWLILYQHRCLFKWARDHRLHHFLDPYHAPYDYNYRYWTGLLLFVRAALYITAAVNVSNDPGINLLAVGCVMFSIVVLKSCLKKNKIYKKWPLEILEMISYLNLTFVCLISFYLQLVGAKSSQRIVAYISGSITLILTVIILFYHIVFELTLKSKFWTALRKKRSTNFTLAPQLENEDNSENEDDQAALVAPTFTEIELPPPGETPLSALLEADAN